MNLPAHRLCLGTVQLGISYGIANHHGKPDNALAEEIVRAAWHAGIQQFDTAQAYGDSEERLGKIFSRLGINDTVKCISKLPPDIDPTNSQALQQALDGSLDRLQLTKLEALMLHRGAMMSSWSQGLSSFVDTALTAQQINGFGLSAYTPDEVSNASIHPQVNRFQVPLNALDERFEQLLQTNTTQQFYLRSIFLQGLLLDPLTATKRLPAATSFVQKLHNFCKNQQVEIEPFLWAWALAQSNSAIIVFGVDTPEQLQQNLNWLTISQTPIYEQSCLLWNQQRPKKVPLNIINPAQWNPQ